jgi:hypothetical protein
MNYRITFDPTTPADVVKTKIQPKPENNRTAPQKKPSTSSATDVGDDLDVNDDDDEDIDEIDPNDVSRERDVALVYEQIADENWPALLARDELNRELEAGRVLKGYRSLKPSFPPTFKVRSCLFLPPLLRAPPHSTSVKRIRGRNIAMVYETRPGETTKSLSSPSSPEEVVEDKKYNLTVADENSETFARSVLSPSSFLPPPLPPSPSRSSLIWTHRSYYDKKRMPSYTDRILTHSLPGPPSLSLTSLTNPILDSL